MSCNINLRVQKWILRKLAKNETSTVKTINDLGKVIRHRKRSANDPII